MHTLTRNIVRISLVALAALLPHAAVAQTLVIEGGTVHPVSRDPFVGHVVIEDGFIREVGNNVAAPPGATRIDASGLHVYPGMFDPLSQVGLIEVGAVAATNDQAEMGAYNPHLEAATAIHPASEVIPVTRANGVTHSVVAPRAGSGGFFSSGDAGVIAGQATLVHLDGWTVEEMAIQRSIAMVIAWPQIVTRRFDFSTFNFKETPFNEAKDKATEQQNELRDWMQAARHYKQAAASDASRAQRNLKLAALAECLDGNMPVIIHAQAERDIKQAVDFAEEQGIRMILAGGSEAWKVADMLAEKDIPVILGLTYSLPREEDDPYDRPFHNASALVAAGVKIAFASGAGGGFGPGGAHSSRTTPYEAKMAAAYGLSDEDALKAMTLWPAEIHGVDDKLGSIEAGKIGNVIVTDGSPLEIRTQVRHLIIDGRVVSTANKHAELYERYRARETATR
jgi:imidazolonepropionase-like amidohydrolase